MAYLENNSTNKLLLANEFFLGTTAKIPPEYITAQVSFNVAGSDGTLEFLHSFDGLYFQTYGDSFHYEVGEHSRQVALKGSYFRVKYINGNANQTNFHLHTRIGTTLNDDMNVNIDYRYDSISVVAGGTGLNTRLLDVNTDSISIPNIEACITGGNSLNVNITGGSLVIGSDTNIFASNGDILTATSGGLDVHVDNFSDIPHLNSTTDSVSIPPLSAVKDSVTAVISGTVPVSGSVSLINQITGYSTSTLQTSSNNLITTSNNLLTDIKNKTLDSNSDSVTVYAGGENGLNIRYLSGTVDSVDVGLSTYAFSNQNPPFPATRDALSNQLCGVDDDENLINIKANPTTQALIVEVSNPSSGITGYALESTQLEVLHGITGINQTIIDKHLNSSTDSVSVNVISGFNLQSTQLEVLNGITGINQTIIDKHLNSSTDSVSVNTISGFNLQSTQLEVLHGITGLETVINNKHLSSSTDSVSVNVISGFATETTLNDIKYKTDYLSFYNEVGINELNTYDRATESIKNNTDGLTNLTFSDNDLNVKVSNIAEGITHVNIDNFPTSFQVSNFPAGITHVNIDNFPTSFQVSNFPSGFNVNNQPTDYPISAGGAYLDAVAQSLFVNVRDTSGNALGVSGNPLYVNNTNNITGFALETGGNLASIKTNTDKFKFTGDDLKSVISNTGFKVLDNNGVAIGGASTALYTTLRDTSGSAIGTSGNPLNVALPTGGGFDGKAYTYSGDGLTAITATGSSLNTNVTNSSINTHCYGSSNGSTWHHLKTDANGILNTHSMTQDGAGTDITSTLNSGKQSLDVNVSNTVPVSGTVGISNFPATQPISGAVSLTDGTDTADITAIGSNLTPTIKGLVCNSVLYGFNGSVNQSQPLSLEYNITSGRNQLTVSDYEATASLSSIDGKATTTNSTLSTINTSIGTTNSTLSTINTSIGTTNSTLSTINGKIPSGLGVSTVNSISSLNVYSVPKATKQYTFGGIDNNATAFRLIGGNSTTTGLAIDDYRYGLAITKAYYATLSAGTANTNLYIDYVNGSGDLIENAGPYAVNASGFTLLPTCISINKFYTTTSIGGTSTTGETLYISPTTNINKSINHVNLANYGVGVFTIPNGYIGYITSINAGYSTAGSVILTKWKTDGFRIPVYKFNIEASLNFAISSGYEGSLGGIFTAGESLAFTNNLATAAKLVMASITLRAI